MQREPGCLESDNEATYNELLVCRCRAGNCSAWEELVEHWDRRLFYYIRRLVEDEQEAWQVLQEVWLKVLRRLDLLQDPRRLAPWLYSITRNTALSHLRQHYRRQALEKDHESCDCAAPDETFRFDNAEQVHWGLGRLKLDQREVLTLYFMRDLSVSEIAQVLSVPEGTVKSRLYYAKRALREILEGQDTDDRRI
jgi:RNA polymerase sigma factor (sigma-70 family)